MELEKLDRMEARFVKGFEGSGAEPPKRCARLQFDEPWQSRAFGIVLAFSEERIINYEDFRQNLIGAIADWEGSHDLDDGTWVYYEQWLTALEKLAIENGMVTKEEVDKRTEEISSGEREYSFFSNYT
ncbi:nitrile hydratase accessory protein [Maritimibacter sp. 55A14]|uniref:nitrile hydratase accessory protein n=1 Tax=Maritimibacter sp. 55A14 TaxID=2174844 RepID=UPI0013048399|nr:nitrile hydratase accessory protein [Maritimibacter sp. 55A14]